jgi:hypothetical protein
MLQMKANFPGRSGEELDSPPGVGADRSLFAMKIVLYVFDDNLVTAHRLIGELKAIGPMRGDALLPPRDEGGRDGALFNRPHEPGR